MKIFGEDTEKHTAKTAENLNSLLKSNTVREFYFLYQILKTISLLVLVRQFLPRHANETSSEASLYLKFEAWGFIEVPFIQEDPLDATIEVVRKEELLDKEESLANNINFIKKYW